MPAARPPPPSPQPMLNNHTTSAISLTSGPRRIRLLWRGWRKVGVQANIGPSLLKLPYRILGDQLAIVQVDAPERRKVLCQVFERGVGDERAIVDFDAVQPTQLHCQLVHTLVRDLVAVRQRQLLHLRAEGRHMVERQVGDEVALFEIEAAQLVARFQQWGQAGIAASLAIGHLQCVQARTTAGQRLG